MRGCWAHEISPLPVASGEERPPACGAGECGKANCPRRRRTSPERTNDLDGLLAELAPEPPDPDELTADVIAGLRARGEMPQELAGLGDRT